MKTAPFRNHPGFWAFAFLAVTGASSCGSDDDHHPEGGASGAVCPAGNTLSYDSFGRDFMQKYCTRCHASSVTGDLRNGAPADHNFDTRADILAMADHIDEHAAAGPDAVNTAMPPDGTAPTEEERRKLGEWLACETSDGDAGGTGDGGGSRGDGSGGQADGNRDATEGGRGDR